MSDINYRNRVHQRFAGAVMSLGQQMNPEQVIMPIGLDGAVCLHLLDYYWILQGIEPQDQLANTLYATSTAGKMDKNKFDAIIQVAYEKGKILYALDIRTKTGKLGSMLRSRAGQQAKFVYAVLFDPAMHADIRGSGEELADEDRKHVYWTQGEGSSDMYRRKERGIWVYDIGHEYIDKLNHVSRIKDFIKQKAL